MNTTGMKQVERCFQLFDAIPWHNLVPDQSDRILLSGRGEYGSLDYICAAQSRDRKYYILYIPEGRPLFFNMKNMSETTMRMHWYNPRSGEALKIGATGHLERFGVVPPSKEDWVLVFDSDDGFKIPNLIE